MARAVGAAVVLAAVVVGLPAALAAAVGWPLPRTVPNPSHLADTLAGHRPLETAVVGKVLALVLWLAWAQVAAAVVVEAAAVVCHRLPRALPGLGPAHGLVAPLVAAVALALPAGSGGRAAARPAPVAAVMPPTPTTVADGPATTPEPPPSPEAVGEAPPVTTVDHVVIRGDNLWDLAERYLGDGHRAGELFELNRGRPQPDGAALADAGLLRPGWVLRVPAPPTDPPGHAEPPGPVVTVEDGDSLWRLAGEFLGDPTRYSELVALNAGRPQPDGSSLVDPDLIHPGWELHLPAPAGNGAASARPPDQVVAPTAPPEAGPAPVDAAQEVVAPQAMAPSPGHQPAPTASGGPAPEASAPAEGADRSRLPAAPVGLLAGGVGTAGLLALVERRRRVQQRRRRRGQRPAPAEPAVEVAERALRAGADVEGAVLVDVALRAAAAGCTAGGLPTLRWVEAGADSVTVVLDGDVPAPPGFVDDGGGRWRSTAPPARLAALGQGVPSPSPALVAVGTTGAGTGLLIDLEAAGVVALGGDGDAVERLLRAMAVSLASAPWADHTRVVVVGGAEDLASVADVEVARDLDGALDELEARARAVAEGLASLGCATTAQARAAGITPDAWVPLVVLATGAPNELQLRRLATLAERSPAGVAAVVLATEGAATPGRVVTVEADGTARLADAGPAVRAGGLGPDDVALVARVLDDTERPAVPAAAGDHDRPRGSEDPPPGGLAQALAEYDVVVRVLGEVEAVRVGERGWEPVAVGRQKSLEAVAFIALSERPVDGEALQSALWPAGTNAARTFQNAVSAARKALGRDRDGAQALPPPVEGRYPVSPRVGTDYGIFRRLVARAERLDDPEAAAALLADALTLVRGEPFTGVGRAWGWVAPQTGMIVAQVVDAAEELAEMRLAAGDWRAAEWAARQGLRVFPCEERLYRLLMRCAHSAGSLPGVRRAFEELVARLADPDDGVEPHDTVHPDTVALLEELTGSGVRRRRVSA